MDGMCLFDRFTERVVAAVIEGGLSCHQAAAQFGGGISTAIMWNQRSHRTRQKGQSLPVTLGHAGDELLSTRRPSRNGAILRLSPGLVDEDQPATIDPFTIFEPLRAAPGNVRTVPLGGDQRLFLTELGHGGRTPTPTDNRPSGRQGEVRFTAPLQQPILINARNLARLVAADLVRFDSAIAARRADQWRQLPPLYRERPRPNPSAGRHRHHGQSRLT